MAEYENMLGEDDTDEDLVEEVENEVNKEVVNKKKKRKVTAVQLEEEDEVFTTNDDVDSSNTPKPAELPELPELPGLSGAPIVIAVEQVEELTCVEKNNGSGSDGRVDVENDNNSDVGDRSKTCDADDPLLLSENSCADEEAQVVYPGSHEEAQIISSLPMADSNSHIQLSKAEGEEAEDSISQSRTKQCTETEAFFRTLWTP